MDGPLMAVLTSGDGNFSSSRDSSTVVSSKVVSFLCSLGEYWGEECGEESTE